MSDLIEKLLDLRSQYNCFDENEHETYHTLSEAIKVLSEQPNDAVSRADVLESFADLYETFEDCSKEIINELHRKFEDLRTLPSVTLKLDHSGDATEMVEYDDCVSRQAVVDVAYEVGNLFEGEDDTRTPYGVAFDIQMAVDKLPSVAPKSEPCEDAVSRAAVIDLIEASDLDLADRMDNKAVCSFVKMIPSVTPKRKTGKWMNLQLIPDDITGHTYGECSICLKLRKVDNFCPNCGADMRQKEETK